MNAIETALICVELKFAISNLRLISRSEKSQKEPFSRKGPVLALGPKEKTSIDRKIERSLGLCFFKSRVLLFELHKCV